LTFQEYLAALFLVKQKSCEKTVADSGSLISGLTDLFKVPMEYDMDTKDQSGSVVLKFFFGIAYTFKRFQNGIGQRMLTALRDCKEYCLPSRLVLCHWAFEAHNVQFVRSVIDKLDEDYFLPGAIHDFIAVAYVIAKTPECTDKAISLSGYNLQDYHLTMLTDLLANEDGKLQVKSLSMQYTSNDGVTGLLNRATAAFKTLLATLAQPFNMCCEVELSFNHNALDVPFLMMLRDALCHRQVCNLIKLDLNRSLSSDALTNSKFIQTLGHCCGLKILDLSGNNLRAPCGRALGEILPQLPLEDLIVSSAKLGDEGMCALNQGLENTCYFGELYLGNNDIHAAGILCLADSICAGKMVIKYHLNLTGNPLGLKGAEAVVRLLSSKHFQTKSVWFNYCKLTTAKIDSAHSISPHSGASITCVGFREWVCRHKIKADGVKILHLVKNNFSGEGIHVLAGFMHLCPQLRSLNCGDCNITSNDLKQLLSLLSQLNLNLERWDLDDNNLDDEGVSALIEHFPMFPSLTRIRIDRNRQVSSEMCRSLKEVCEKVPL
jgi:Ran GTPase-activating protein (RanGAP) involved in mRNA processing and transport